MGVCQTICKIKNHAFLRDLVDGRGFEPLLTEPVAMDRLELSYFSFHSQAHLREGNPRKNL